MAARDEALALAAVDAAGLYVRQVWIACSAWGRTRSTASASLASSRLRGSSVEIRRDGCGRSPSCPLAIQSPSLVSCTAFREASSRSSSARSVESCPSRCAGRIVSSWLSISSASAAIARARFCRHAVIGAREPSVGNG
jgi:hypothetical protein